MSEIAVGSQWRGKESSGYRTFIATVNEVDPDYVWFKYKTSRGSRYTTVWNRPGFEKYWEPIPQISATESNERRD